MSDHVILRRPDAGANAEEQLAYRRAIVAAHERLGVRYGDEFAISAVERETLEDLDQRVGPVARGGSETSRQAAYDNFPRAGSQRWRVLLAIYLRPRTRDELAADLNLSDSSADPRVWELKKGGFIEDAEETRTTRHKSQAVVLRCTLHGAAEVVDHKKEGTP